MWAARTISRSRRRKNPVALMALVGRVLPLQMKTDKTDSMVPRRVILELDE